MITAEQKTKTQKNGNVHNYIYYRCSKKTGKCLEKYIAASELDKQLTEIISSITIDEEFQQWALKYLHEVRTQEALTDEQVLKAKQVEYENIIKRLQNLLLKYTDPANSAGELMTDKEYSTIRSDLMQQKASLESELNAKGKEISEWVELTEKTFNFARYARIWFEQGDLETKKAIFSALGSDFVLKNQKLHVELNKPFAIISQGVSILRAENNSARTSESVSRAIEKPAFAGNNSIWLERWDSNPQPID